jgi:peptide/nickel transport system substrate-binding protein
MRTLVTVRRSFRGISRRWLACFGILALIACSGKEGGSGRGTDSGPVPVDAKRIESSGIRGGTLRYCLPGEPSTFNPILAASESRAKLISHMTSATLLEYDPFEDRIVPGLAKEWLLVQDKKLQIELRTGLRFSNGADFTADDVLFTFAKILEQGSRNTLKDSLVFDGRPLTIEKTGAFSVQIGFPEPFAGAEFLLTTIPIIPRSSFQGKEQFIEDFWGVDTLPETMAGLGPFQLAEHLPGQKSVLRRNPHYWKADGNGIVLPYLDEIQVYYVEDRNTRMLRLKAGDLDIVDQLLAPEDFIHLQTAGHREITTTNAGASGRLSVLWFNLNPADGSSGGKSPIPPEKSRWFQSPYFRRAVNQAINRQSIVDNVFMGQATAAWTLVPPSMKKWHWSDCPGCEFNLEAARALLREGGFDWVRKGSRMVLADQRGREVGFELLTRADPVFGKIAAMIQHDLAELGMQVTIRQEELRSVISRIMGSFQYEAALMNIDIPVEPCDHVNVLLSSGPMHMWRPRQKEPVTPWEKEIDRLMLEHRSCLQLSERQRLYGEVQRLLVEQAPLIPIVNSDVLVASRSWVANLRAATVHPYSLWNVWQLSTRN